MTDVAFYHLEHWPLERVLPKLLEKTLGAGKRALVKVGSEARAEALSQAIWTMEPNSWLPHGTQKDGKPDSQPIWLTADGVNANGAEFLFLADGAEADDLSAFERCFDLFNGKDEAAVGAARLRWKTCKDAGHDLTYWQQTPGGKWEKKA